MIKKVDQKLVFKLKRIYKNAVLFLTKIYHRMKAFYFPLSFSNFFFLINIVEEKAKISKNTEKYISFSQTDHEKVNLCVHLSRLG